MKPRFPMFTAIDPVNFGFILFFIFVGTGFKLFVPSDNPDTTSLGARVYTQFAAMLLIGSIFGFLLMWTSWSPWLLGPAGLLASLGSGNLIKLTAEFFDNKEGGLTGFLGRLAQALQAGWKVFSAAKNDTPHD